MLLIYDGGFVLGEVLSYGGFVLGSFCPWGFCPRGVMSYTHFKVRLGVGSGGLATIREGALNYDSTLSQMTKFQT